MVRPEYKTPEDLKAALDFIKGQMEKPYDSGFDFEDDSRFCCSELIYRAFQSIPNKIDVPVVENI
jgi:hypothetical protein